MGSKDIRNIILALVILAIGVKLLLWITEKFVNVAAAGEIGKALGESGNLFFFGALVFAAILVPFYLSARSNEKKGAG